MWARFRAWVDGFTAAHVVAWDVLIALAFLFEGLWWAALIYLALAITTAALDEWMVSGKVWQIQYEDTNKRRHRHSRRRAA